MSEVDTKIVISSTLNEVEAANFLRLQSALRGSHYVSILIRKNGRNEIFQADWLQPHRATFTPPRETVR